MEQYLQRLKNNEVFLALISLAGILVLYTLRNVLMVLIIAFVIVVALRPFVVRVSRRKVPNALAAVLVVAAVAVILGTLLYIIFSGLTDQFDQLRSSINQALQQLPFAAQLEGQVSLQSFSERLLNNTGQYVTTFTSAIVEFIIGLITALVLSIYWLIDYDKIKQYLLSKSTRKQKFKKAFSHIEQRLGGWVRGQLTISIIIGTLSYITYLIIGLPAALALAIIAGLLEIVPTLGPILAAVPATLIGLTISPRTALIVLLANVVIQQLENHLIAPKVLQKTAHLHPMVVILSLFIGGELFGLLGVLLAVPVTLIALSIKKGYQTAK